MPFWRIERGPDMPPLELSARHRLSDDGGEPSISTSPPPPLHPIHPYALTIDACHADASESFLNGLPLPMESPHWLSDNRACTDEYSKAAVRCCHDDGSCGVSVCAAERGGAPPKTTKTRGDEMMPIDGSAATYFQAHHECRLHGLRLCQEHELASCCGHGCGFDSVRVWSLTQCTHEVTSIGVLDDLVIPALHPALASLGRGLLPFSELAIACLGVLLLILASCGLYQRLHRMGLLGARGGGERGWRGGERASGARPWRPRSAGPGARTVVPKLVGDGRKYMRLEEISGVMPHKPHRRIKPSVPKLRSRFQLHPGMIAAKRADGSHTGMLVVCRSTSQGSPRQCDLLLYREEAEARTVSGARRERRERRAKAPRLVWLSEGPRLVWHCKPD